MNQPTSNFSTNTHSTNNQTGLSGTTAQTLILQQPVPVKGTVDGTHLLHLHLPLANGKSLNVQQQLTLHQAANLSSDLRVLIQQQTAIVFAASQISQWQLPLSPGMKQALLSWFKTGDKDLKRLPSEVSQLLSAKLGEELSSEKESLKSKLLTIQLTSTSLIAQSLNSEPLLKVKLPSTELSQMTEVLPQLLQILLPVSEDHKSYIVLKQSRSENGEEDTKVCFEMQFELKKLGSAIAKITLKEFSLNCHWLASSGALQQTLNDTLPALEERLSKFGFSSRFSQELTIPNEQTAASNRRLVDIKV